MSTFSKNMQMTLRIPLLKKNHNNKMNKRFL